MPSRAHHRLLDATRSDCGAGATIRYNLGSPSFAGLLLSTSHEPLQQQRARSESPSLCRHTAGAARAFEIKFLLDAALAADVEGAIASRLVLDPHAVPALGNAYRITSLYCDTPARAVLHRVGWHRYRKFRLRRYGDADFVYLECKTKCGAAVEKRRVRIAADELAWLDDPGAPRDWVGAHYGQQLRLRSLRPVCCISYLRRAYFGGPAGQDLRVTFDRGIEAAPRESCDFATATPRSAVLEGRVVGEFKFRGPMPLVAREIVAACRLTPAAVSKYRQCMQSFECP